MQKGQGATELVILLAVILVVLSLIFIFSQNKITESTNLLRLSQARSAVNDLAKAVAEVNSEGVGARRKVQITIPDGLNSSRTSISGKTINIGVIIEGTTADVNARTQAMVAKGVNFPTTPGTYLVSVTAKEGYVLIGDTDLSVDPTYISIELLYSNSTTRTINFTNLGSSAISVTSTLVWDHSEINAQINNTNSLNFVLDVGSNPSQIVLNVTTLTNTTLGVYTGAINVLTNETESLSIPVVVNVVGTQPSSGGVSYIIVDTYKNASYSTPLTNFTRPTPVNITGAGWVTSSTATINIFPNSLGPSSSVSGYPQNIATNSTGGFFHQWNPSGYNASTYNISVNQSALTASTLIDITACAG